MRPLSITVLLLALTACPAKKREVRAPDPVVDIEESSPWKVRRSEGVAVVEGPDGLRLYAGGAPRGSGDRYPGVALGTARGPNVTLLSGAYAPLLIPDESDQPYRVRLESFGSTIAVDVGEAFTARVTPPQHGRVRIVTRGAANLVLPANETKLSGQRDGRPLFSEVITAGQEPGLEARGASRLEVTVPDQGVITVESECTARWIRPLPRGSTSSFLIRLGPPRRHIDPRYAPTGATDEGPACAGTATITVPWPPSP